jgi:hypothetical protein
MVKLLGDFYPCIKVIGRKEITGGMNSKIWFIVLLKVGNHIGFEDS